MVSRELTYRLLRMAGKRREAQKVYDITVSCEPAAFFWLLHCFLECIQGNWVLLGF